MWGYSTETPCSLQNTDVSEPLSMHRVGYGSNFNEIVIRDETLSKRSINAYGHKKMENEMAFYEFLIENNLTLDIPEIIRIDRNMHRIDMRYLKNHVPLYKVYFDKTDSEKREILYNIVENLAKIHCQSVHVTPVVYWKDLYLETLDKIKTRLVPIQSLLEKYIHVTRVNGVSLKSVDDILSTLTARVNHHVDNCEDCAYAFIHGDCQFNNILIDTSATNKCDNSSERTEGLVFIDPRGYYGETKLFGLKEYDYAKVLFALSGYDLFDNAVVNQLHIDGNNVIISDFIQNDFYTLLVSVTPLSDIVIPLFISIWLGNAHMFIDDEAKCMTSYFIAMYYASTYL